MYLNRYRSLLSYFTGPGPSCPLPDTYPVRHVNAGSCSPPAMSLRAYLYLYLCTGLSHTLTAILSFTCHSVRVGICRQGLAVHLRCRCRRTCAGCVMGGGCMGAVAVTYIIYPSSNCLAFTLPYLAHCSPSRVASQNMYRSHHPT